MNTGDLLTASAINAINSQYTFSFTVPYNGDDIGAYMPGDGFFYVHRNAGQLFLDLNVPTAGLLQGGQMRFTKWVDGDFNEVLWAKEFTWLPGGLHEEHIMLYSTGQGYYWADSYNLQMNEMTGYVYLAQADIQRGDKLSLTYYPVPSSVNNGSLATGSYITAPLVNAQRVKRAVLLEE